jgi:single-strand DNA-binding protein
MPSYDMTGNVKAVMDQQNFDSGFTKREFVVTTEEDRFPQDIKFQCVKEKVSLLDNVKEGDRVNVTFDLRGNEYNDRYYVDLTAWKVAPADDERDPKGDGEGKEPVPPF